MATMAVRVAALEERVTNLEAQCRQTDETAAAAGAAHKHNTRLLMALRETQVEHGQLLVGHGQRLDAIDAKLAEHDRRFDAIDARFTAVDARFTAVDARFDALDTEIASIKGTLGRVAVGMYAIEKLIRRIAPDDIGADDTGAVAGT